MRRAALIAAAAVALGGCGLGAGGGDAGQRAGEGTGGSRSERGERPPSDREQLQSLVGRRAKALSDGDARALSATAGGRRRARDRRAARRVRRMGVHRVRSAVVDADVDGSRAVLVVRTTYAVRGIAGRFASRQRMHAARSGGRWRLRRIAAARQQPPWEVAEFRRVRTRHFVVLAPPGVDPAGGGLSRALEAGYQRIRSLLSRGRLRGRYLVVVAASGAQARALTAQIRGVAQLAALTDSEVREEGVERRVAEVVSQRLIVVWPPFQAAGAEAGETVIAHELTHAVLAPSTSGRTPGWLVEGIALYISQDRRVGEAAELLGEGAPRGVSRRVLSLTGLGTPDSIARLSGADQSAAYAYASSAAHYIVARYGHRRLMRLQDAFSDPEVVGPAGSPSTVDAAVRRVLRVSLPGLERNLRRWIVTRAVVSPLDP